MASATTATCWTASNTEGYSPLVLLSQTPYVITNGDNTNQTTSGWYHPKYTTPGLPSGYQQYLENKRLEEEERRRFERLNEDFMRRQLERARRIIMDAEGSGGLLSAPAPPAVPPVPAVQPTGCGPVKRVISRPSAAKAVA
jgi:hypothetical protein